MKKSIGSKTSRKMVLCKKGCEQCNSKARLQSTERDVVACLGCLIICLTDMAARSMLHT